MQKNHSLNYDKKKQEDIELLKSNMELMKRIQKVESHTKFDDHQSEWTQKKRLRGLVAVVSKNRLNGLVTLRSPTNSTLRNFQSRNQSMSPTSSLKMKDMIM